MSKISELSDGGSLQSTDYLIAVRSGGNVKVRPNGAVSGTTGQFSTSLNVDGTVTADGLIIDTPAAGAAATISMRDNTADSFVVKQGTNEYINVDTTNTLEVITVGNTTTTPDVIIPGGNVGIGTTSPGRLVDLKVSDNTDGARLRLRSANAIDSYPTIGSVEFYSDDNSVNSSGIVGSIDVEGIGTWNGAANNAAMTFNLIQGLAGTTSPVEAMRIDSSGHAIIPAGVTLGTSAGVYSAANTLDDYEEGTFTPALHRFTGGDVTATYSSQTGRYTKIGRLVNVEIDLVVTSISAQGSSYAMVSGLPFNYNGNAYTTIGVVTTNSVSGEIIIKAFASGTRLFLGRDESTGFPPVVADFNTGSTNLRCSITYMTDA